MSTKFILTVIIFSIIFYISACIITDYDISTVTHEELRECFEAYVHTNNTSELEISAFVLGTWEYDLNNQYKLVKFLSSGEYFIYDKNIILGAGTYQIVKDKNTFTIETMPNSTEIAGIINICGRHIFNVTTGTIWLKRW